MCALRENAQTVGAKRKGDVEPAKRHDHDVRAGDQRVEGALKVVEEEKSCPWLL